MTQVVSSRDDRSEWTSKQLELLSDDSGFTQGAAYTQKSDDKLEVSVKKCSLGRLLGCPFRVRFLFNPQSSLLELQVNPQSNFLELILLALNHHHVFVSQKPAGVEHDHDSDKDSSKCIPVGVKQYLMKFVHEPATKVSCKRIWSGASKLELNPLTDYPATDSNKAQVNKNNKIIIGFGP